MRDLLIQLVKYKHWNRLLYINISSTGGRAVNLSYFKSYPIPYLMEFQVTKVPQQRKATRIQIVMVLILNLNIICYLNFQDKGFLQCLD